MKLWSVCSSPSPTEASVGYSTTAADQTFSDQLRLFQQTFSSQVLRINTAIMAFPLRVPATPVQQVHSTRIDLASEQFYQCFIFETLSGKQKRVINL